MTTTKHNWRDQPSIHPKSNRFHSSRREGKGNDGRRTNAEGRSTLQPSFRGEISQPFGNKQLLKRRGKKNGNGGLEQKKNEKSIDLAAAHSMGGKLGCCQPIALLPADCLFTATAMDTSIRSRTLLHLYLDSLPVSCHSGLCRPTSMPENIMNDESNRTS